MSPVLEVRGLVKHYAVERGLLRTGPEAIRAVDGIDLSIERGECLGLVGESGSGKTTVARMIMCLMTPDAGEIEILGTDVLALSGRSLRRFRRHFQMVFQDPYGSLNPRLRVRTIVGEPLLLHRMVSRRQVATRVTRLLETVGLPASAAERYPHEFSGGQRQRIAIARALATGPELLVADEPVSALDVSVRAQILNLLVRLQGELGLAMLFIAHDLAVVEQVAHRVAVMTEGRIVEEGPREEVFRRPRHPYTRQLLAAAPRIDGREWRRQDAARETFSDSMRT